MDVSLNTQQQASGYVFTNQLDQDFLNKNFAQNLELAQNIFKSFLDNTLRDLEQLKLAAEDNNHILVASISHKIKNNFIYIGASELKDELSQLENAAKEKSQEVRKIYASFHVKMERLLPIIKDEFKRLEDFIIMKEC